MRRLSAFENFAIAEDAPASRSILPDILSPAQQISRVFPFQSYFDDVLLERALTRQPQNDPIVASTLREEQIPGYAIALHPSSQTPVAIEFRVGSQKSSSAPHILKPGEILRPYGVIPGVRSGTFAGFRWGIPFGWLGGGLATLVVFETPDSHVHWTEGTEVIFHRARFQIQDPAAVAAPFPFNWPLRFPWTRALFESTTIPQGGKAAVAIAAPTRAVSVLRVPSLAAPAMARFHWIGSNDFGLDANGTPIVTEAVFSEQVWPTYPASLIPGVPAFPLATLNDPSARLAADDGSLIITSEDAALQGQYVDIVRYGSL